MSPCRHCMQGSRSGKKRASKYAACDTGRDASIAHVDVGVAQSDCNCRTMQSTPISKGAGTGPL